MTYEQQIETLVPEIAKTLPPELKDKLNALIIAEREVWYEKGKAFGRRMLAEQEERINKLL